MHQSVVHIGIVLLACLIVVLDGWLMNKHNAIHSGGTRQWCGEERLQLTNAIWWLKNTTSVSRCADICSYFKDNRGFCDSFNIIVRPTSNGTAIDCQMMKKVPRTQVGCRLNINNQSTWYHECKEDAFKIRLGCCDTYYYKADCEWWASRGECLINPRWMLKNCAASCNASWACSNKDGEVKDHSDQCAEWATWGECQGNNTKWMKENCNETCTNMRNSRACNVSHLMDVPNTEQYFSHKERLHGPMPDMVKFPYHAQYRCAAKFHPVDFEGKDIPASWAGSGFTTCAPNGTWIRSIEPIGQYPTCVSDVQVPEDSSDEISTTESSSDEISTTESSVTESMSSELFTTDSYSDMTESFKQ